MAYLKWIFWALVVLIVGGFLHYTLPRHQTLRIVESEVRRVELANSNGLFWGSAEPADATTGSRDVKFISAVYEGGKPLVLRNEDTGWGWPPYFKFNSSDVQARAADLISATGNPQWVSVEFYGWRSQLFSIYPNVLKLTAVDGPDHRVIPWFKMIVLGGLVVLIVLVRVMLKRFWRNRVDPVVARVAEGFEDADEAMDGAVDGARNRFRGRRQKFREWWIETFG
jgi:hypothetical protein